MMLRFLLALSVVCFATGTANADEFLGLPLVPGGEVMEKTEALLVMKAPLSHDQALEFFKNALNGQKDIKIREWESATFIEDDGNRPWHSINIPKHTNEKITITIKKDNWAWILSTLTLRYIAVFVVLMVIYVSILVSGKIISSALRRAEQKKAAAAAP